MGLASFAFDFRPIRRFAERDHANIVSWSEFDRGSHWAAHDAPDLLLGDLRQFFRPLPLTTQREHPFPAQHRRPPGLAHPGGRWSVRQQLDL